MDEERKLMQNLGKVERYKYKNDQLLLLSSRGETVITTQKAKKKK
jgi:heat shock protein HslJ